VTDTHIPPPTNVTPGDQDRGTAHQAADRGREVAGTAAEQGKEVARTAAEQTRGLASTASEQAASVGSVAMEQARSVLDTTTHEVRHQADVRLRDLAEQARGIQSEIDALLDGRPEDGGRTADVARTVSRQIGRMAERADDLGVQGVLEEVSDLARRRPVLFLAGAAATGVLVGRMARAGKEAQSQPSSDRRPGASPETVDLTTGWTDVPSGATAPAVVGVGVGGTAGTTPGAVVTPPLPPPTETRPTSSEPGRPSSGWTGA
jgi:hypothetical protein